MSNLDAAFNMIQKSAPYQGQQALLDKQQAAMKPAVDTFNKTADSPMPSLPELQKQPAAPKQGDFGVDAQEWVGAMAALSAVTGAFSRGHATTALKAFGAGVKGYQDGNKEAFDAAHKQWKDASEEAIQNNKILTDKYKEVLDQRNLSEQEQTEKLKMIGSLYHDPLMAASENIHQSIAIYESQKKAAERAQEHMEKMKEKNEQLKASEYSKDEIDFYAKQLNAGDQTVLSNAGRTAAASFNIAGIRKRAAELNMESGVTPEQQAKKNIDFAAGRAGEISESRAEHTAGGKIKLAANSLDESLPLLETAIKNVDLSQFPDINTLENYAKTHSGNPEITALNAALQTTVTDYSTLIARNGQRTDATDAAAKHLANVNMGDGQLKAFIAQVRKEKAAQLRAIEKTYKNDTSSSASDGWSIEPVR